MHRKLKLGMTAARDQGEVHKSSKHPDAWTQSRRRCRKLREAGDALVDRQVDAIDVPPCVTREEHHDLGHEELRRSGARVNIRRCVGYGPS